MITISKKTFILSSISTLALLISINSHAKIYKWIDANGQTHYTAQPPAQSKKGIKAENIEDKIKSNAGKYRPSSKTTKVAAAETDNSDDTKSEDELSGPDKQLVEYCKGQRNNLSQLQKNFRNVWIDASGKKTSLNQEQRRAKVASLQKKITEDCSEVKVAEKT